MLDADGEPDHLRRHAHTGLFGLGELPVRGGGRMASQGFGVADVHQPLEELERVVELHARLEATLHPKREDAGGAAAHVALREIVVAVSRQAGVAHPFHLGVILEVLRGRQGVVAVALHAQIERFDALHHEEGVERRNGGAGVAQRHRAGAADVRRGA